MIFYHRTRQAEAIMQNGFGSHTGLVIGPHRFKGVFLSDSNEGAKGDQLLEITIPDQHDISDFELMEDGKHYREWCVPVAVIKKHGTCRLLTKGEARVVL